MTNRLYFDHSFRDDLFQFGVQESKRVGFWGLPDGDISELIQFGKNVEKKYIVVIGIGGSSLGAEAIYNFLYPKIDYDKELLFLDTTDPVQILNQLEKIDLSNSLFFAISKSGTTVESIAILKYLDSMLNFSRENLVIITDPESPLEGFGESRELQIFHIPKAVGGRYSVLSSAGLLPLASIGVDIEKVVLGAKKVKDAFLDGEFSQVVNKAIFYGENRDSYPINVLFSYSNSLKTFNEWFVQLWGESLGKFKKSGESVGLTPVGLVGPKDQHSFLQLLMEGKKDKSVTFIKIKDMSSQLSIPNSSLSKLEKVDILNGVKFEDLINLQADSTFEALQTIGGVPLDTIEIERIDEESIGGLMFYHEILTSLTAEVMGINPYDQEGVELGKRILKRRLAERV
jgi:glucose-6-phosphate isomerase